MTMSDLPATITSIAGLVTAVTALVALFIHVKGGKQ